MYYKLFTLISKISTVRNLDISILLQRYVSKLLVTSLLLPISADKILIILYIL